MIQLNAKDYDGVKERVSGRTQDDFRRQVGRGPEEVTEDVESILVKSGLRRLVARRRCLRRRSSSGGWNHMPDSFVGIRCDEDPPEYLNGPWSAGWAETVSLPQAIEWAFLGSSKYGNPEEETIQPYQTGAVRGWLIKNFADEVVRILGPELGKLRRKAEDCLRKDRSFLLSILSIDRPLGGPYV